MARRGRRRPPESLGDSILAALAGVGLTDQARRLRIFTAWEKAVGPEIAGRTAPESFRRGTLLVRVASATWQNELTFLKAEIIAKLNAELGDAIVRDLKIVAGRVTPRRVETAPVELVKPTPEQRALADRTAEVIPDPEVRERFARMMALDHARRSATNPRRG